MSSLLAGLDDSVEQCGRGIVRRQKLPGQAGIADHAHQQVVEVVRDPGRQRSGAFQFPGLPQALFGQAFIKAYEEQVAQDRAKRKRG